MKLLVDSENVWYKDVPPCSTSNIGGEDGEQRAYASSMSEADKSALKVKATNLYKEQVIKYRAQRDMSKADLLWFQKILKEGTLTDKISAMTLQIQEAPFYGLEWIEKLLEMAVSVSRHEAYPAIEALKDVFLLAIPPKATVEGERIVLKTWKDSNVTDKKELTSSKQLLIAYFMDAIRQNYIEYLRILEIVLHDQVVNGRERALRVVFELALACKCDFGEALCQLLVAKLGDPERKVASRVVYYLQLIIEKNEDFTFPIVKSVQTEIMRPLKNDKAAYYGLTFFSQVKLNDSSPKVTDTLLTTYQHFLQIFLDQLGKVEKKGGKKDDKRTKRRMALKRKKDKADGEVGVEGGERELLAEMMKETTDGVPRIMKVVLLGLTRAIPFARNEALVEYANKLLELASKIRSFSTLLQASTLIFRIFSDKMEASTMNLLTELISRHLLEYSRMVNATFYHPKLFKLLYKITSSLGDTSTGTGAMDYLGKIMKALLRSAATVPSPAFAAATLLLLNEALSMRPGLRMAISFPEDNEKGGDSSLYWELLLLSKHYHPTVARYAVTLLQPRGEIDIRNEPEDPFQALSNSAFLESFIKEKATKRGKGKGKASSNNNNEKRGKKVKIA